MVVVSTLGGKEEGLGLEGTGGEYGHGRISRVVGSVTVD